MSSSLRIMVYDASPAVGGAATSLDALCHVIRRAGHEISVVACCPDIFSECADVGPVAALECDDFGATQGGAYLAREARRAAQLHGLMAQTKPQVLLCNNAPSTNAAGLVAASSLDIPCVQYVRGPIDTSRLNWNLLSLSRSVLSVGEEATLQCRQLGATPIAIGEALSASQQPLLRATDADGIFWCASLARWKGLDLALGAYALAAMSGSLPTLDACFVPFPVDHPDGQVRPSNPPAGARLFEESARLGEIRARNHIFLHTSLSPEPYGRSILEAATAGLCPVVPDHSTASGLVLAGRTGLTYAPGNREALADALLYCARERDRVLTLGQAARVSARRIHAEETYAPVLGALERASQTRRGRRTRNFRPQPLLKE